MSVTTSSWLPSGSDEDLLAGEQARRADRVARRKAKAQLQAVDDEYRRRQRLSRALANALRHLEARRRHESLVQARHQLAERILADHSRPVEAATERPVGALTEHLRAALASSPDSTSIALLRDLVDAGLLQFAVADDVVRLFAFFSPVAPSAPTSSPAPILELTSAAAIGLVVDPTYAPSSGPRWSWWEALHRLSTATLNRRAITALASSGEPALLDDLLAAGQSVAVADATHCLDEQTRLYLRARIHPEALTDVEVSRLGWREENRRRAFNAGHDVDPDVPDRLSALRYLRSGMLADALRAAERIGAEDIVAVIAALMADDIRTVQILEQDESLWPVVEVMDDALASLSNSRLNRLRHWLALRRARALIYDIRLAEARPVLRDLLKDKPEGRFLLEAANMAAYVEAITGKIPEARKIAQKMRTVKFARDGVQHNLTRLTDVTPGDVEDFESPYALLGLDEGSLDWQKAWLRRTKELNHAQRHDARADLNRGKQRLEDETRAKHYVLPLQPATFAVPTGHLLSPRAVPIPRTTRVDYPTLLSDAQELACEEALLMMAPRVSLRVDPNESQDDFKPEEGSRR